MSRSFQVSVQAEEEQQRVTVLRIASAARNSVSQFYNERVQVSPASLNDLHRKVHDKLRLHRIDNVQLVFTIQYENDKTVVLTSPEALTQYDTKVEARTQLVSVKWSFVCDVNGDGQDHLHSIYVRVSERPHPGLILQKAMSGHAEDLDSLDNDAFATIACKVDFIDNRFSSELLSVVTEWVTSLPKVEPTFGLIKWLRSHEDRITSFVYGVLPAVALLGYIGIWLRFVPSPYSDSVRIVGSWALGGGVIFLISRYLAVQLNTVFVRHLSRISKIPVLIITAGDNNRMTKYLARSQSSMVKLAGAGFVYGVFKFLGLYFATYIFRSF